MKAGKELLNLFPAEYCGKWETLFDRYDEIREIRIRVNAPVIIHKGIYEKYMESGGLLTDNIKIAHVIKREEMNAIFYQLCHSSPYAYEPELRQGFMTVQGGHRIGLTGQVVLEENHIRTIKNISSMNIRVAHQVIGAADGVMPYLFHNNQFINTMIISPPGGGKTTLLRDIIRQVSNGTKYGNNITVGVVDERSEIGGSYQGVIQNDLGIRTDLLDGCPKVLGMMMLIRSMAPQLIAVDELGEQEEIEALRHAMCCGSKILVTIHADSMEELQKKEKIAPFLKEKAFERYILLDSSRNAGSINKILDGDGKNVAF